VRELHGAPADYLRELELRFRDLDLRGVRVLLDCANGASYRVAPEAFRRLGAEVEVVAGSVDAREFVAWYREGDRLVGAIGIGVYKLRDPAMQVVAQVPETAQRIRDRIRSRQNVGGTLQQVQRAATQLEQAAQDASQPTQPPKGVQKVQIVEPAFKASDYLYWGGVGLAGALGQSAVILFLVYFFLVTGDLYKRKIVKIAGPHLSQKKLTVQILDDINQQIENFIRVQVFTSALVGVATMAALWMMGLQQWIIWGLLSGILNTIPYLGPVIVTGGLAIVAFLQFDSIAKAAIICAVAFAITSLEGFLLMPALMGRAARMNPVAIFVGLLFWSWIWGAWGAVLAVPMLMMLKAVCDHIDDLKPIAELLGE
jgi:predicted PurR-regulated permease PerM